MVVHRKIEISGTVVPRRDFHRNTLETPLNKGSPRVFPSQACATARARLRSHA